MDTDGALEFIFSETEGVSGLPTAKGTIELDFIPVNTGVCGSQLRRSGDVTIVLTRTVWSLVERRDPASPPFYWL